MFHCRQLNNLELIINYLMKLINLKTTLLNKLKTFIMSGLNHLQLNFIVKKSLSKEKLLENLKRNVIRESRTK